MHSQLRNKHQSVVKDALVAQLVEHLTLNQRVQGSSPCRRTKRHFRVSLFLFVHIVFLFKTPLMSFWGCRNLVGIFVEIPYKFRPLLYGNESIGRVSPAHPINSGVGSCMLHKKAHLINIGGIFMYYIKAIFLPHEAPELLASESHSAPDA